MFNNTELIAPNWHVVLIHFPLGLLGMGIVIEILGFLWRSSSVRGAARWMILLGTLACVPAITSGLFAYRQAINPSPDGRWSQVVSHSHFSPEQWEIFKHHILFNVLGTGLLALEVVLYLASSDRLRKQLYWLTLVVICIGYGLLSIGAWNGGHGVFRYATGYAPPEQAVSPDLQTLTNNGHWIEADAQAVFPPIQLHLMLAGLTFALCLAALGLSIRRLLEDDPSDAALLKVEQMQSPDQLASPTPTGQIAMGQNDLPLDHDLQSLTADDLATTPATRWWVVMAIMALGTAAAGLWTSSLTTPAAIRREFGDSWQQASHHRIIVHAIVGVCLLLTALTMAIVARFGRRNKTLLITFALLLLALIAAQVWVGITLLFDSGVGSLNRFG